MLFRALTLFLVLNSVFLATESQKSRGKHGRNCVVIKNIYGEYLTVNSEFRDPERKLVLESDFKEQRSLFRFENQDRKVRGRTVYRIERCDNDQAVSWAPRDLFKLMGDNYFAFANNFKGVDEFDTWVLKFESDDTFVQILDAESGGRFNLFSAWTTDENGNPLALVYDRDWPLNDPSQEEKIFWTIEDAPGHRGSFENTFGRTKRPSSGQSKRPLPRPPKRTPFFDKPSKPSTFDKPSKPSIFDKPSKPSFVDFNPFDGKPGKPGFNRFDDSPILDAEKEVDDHGKPLVDENDDDDEEETTKTTTTSTTTTEEPDHEEEEEEENKEEEEVLAAESKPKSKPRQPCYILKQQFRGLTYTMGLDTKKTQGGQKRTNVIMEQRSSRSSENAWRLVPESDRTFSSKYKIQNCKTDDILSVSYKQSIKSDNRDGDVFVIDGNRIPEDEIQVWNVDERKGNKILISDASKPSFYLSVTSNAKNPKIRDVVSTIRDNTDSQSIVFTFEEFKN